MSSMEEIVAEIARKAIDTQIRKTFEVMLGALKSQPSDSSVVEANPTAPKVAPTPKRLAKARAKKPTTTTKLSIDTVLATLTEPMSQVKLAAALGVGSRKVKPLVAELVKAGKVVRSGSGPSLKLERAPLASSASAAK